MSQNLEIKGFELFQTPTWVTQHILHQIDRDRQLCEYFKWLGRDNSQMIANGDVDWFVVHVQELTKHLEQNPELKFTST